VKIVGQWKGRGRMNIIQDFIPVGRRNRPNRLNPMLFVTVHETGNTNRGANARAHGNYLRSNDAANVPVSWHYTVDDTEIVQHLPES
jgi:N-acetylmuramoyl-L-alanine amidase